MSDMENVEVVPVAPVVEQVAEQAEQVEQPVQQEAQAEEPEDHEKLPSWAKKKLRNFERRVSSLSRKVGYFEAQAGNQQNLQNRQDTAINDTEQDDSDRVALSRHELSKLIEQEARKLAPTLREQETEIEHRRRVVEGLAKELGRERFDAVAADLDAALDGLTDPKGNPKPAAAAIFESDDPKGVVEYLADPDNAAEAAALARMNAIQAGKAIAKLEIKLQAAKSPKPQASKAPAPIEAAKGRGQPALDGYSPNMSDAEFIAWRRKQIAQRA